MKFRSTLVLLLAAGALFAYIFFFESHRKTSREAADSVSRVVQVDRDKINSISIRNSEAKIELRRGDDAQWRLESPVKDRADSAAIAQLFTDAEFRAEEAIPVKKENKDELREYGVADSSTKLKLVGDGKPVDLIFGKDTAIAGKGYVYSEAAGKVYVASNELRAQVSKKADDFRDRRLTDLTIQKITKMVVKSPAGELELEKRINHWFITKPLLARGDDPKINDLTAQTITARIDKFISDPNLAAYGLSEPRGSISFTVEGSEKPIVIQIGGHPKEEKGKEEKEKEPKEKEMTYVKLSTRDGLELTAKNVENALETKPDDIRDRNLIRLESDIVDRITIESGSEKLTLARTKGDSWVRKDGNKDVEIHSPTAAHILSEMQRAQVADFVSDAAVDLPSYGLDHPQLTVTFSSYASENTAETNKGDKPILSVLFGHPLGGNVFAKIDSEPTILAVNRTLLESIPTSPIQLQDPAISHFKPEEVTALEVSGKGLAGGAAERDQDGRWKLTKGSGKLDEMAARQLTEILANLRAIRWLGPVSPDFGLDHPTIAIHFTTTVDGKKTPGALTIGDENSDGRWVAASEGLPGAFLLSKTVVEGLRVPLTDAPPPKTETPSATAEPAPPAAARNPLAEPVAPATPPPAPAPGTAAPAEPAHAPPATPMPAPIPLSAKSVVSPAANLPAEPASPSSPAAPPTSSSEPKPADATPAPTK